MANAPTLDFNAFVTRRKAERAEGDMENAHDYSYILDRQTRATFDEHTMAIPHQFFDP